MTERLKELLEKATQGEWEFVTGEFGAEVGIYGPNHADELIAELSSSWAEKLRASRGIVTPDIANAHLIVAMKSALPSLLACAEALENVLGFGINGTMESQMAQDEARSALAQLEGLK